MQKKRRDYPWQRWRRRIFIGSFVIFGLVPGALSIIAWRSQVALERDMQAIRDKGFPVSLADLAATYPEPPTGQNAAEIYQQSFTKQARPASQASYEDIMREFNHTPGRGPLAGALHKTLSDAVQANAEALRLLHEAAGRPASRYPLDFSKGFNHSLPHLAGVLYSARLLQLETLLAADEGDANRALEAVAAAFAAADSVRREPLPISQLVRITCHDTIFDAVKYMLNRISFSEEQLVRLAGLIQAAEDSGAFTRALAGERVMALAAFEHPEQILAGIPEVQSLGPVGADAAAGLVRMTGMAAADRRRYLAYMDEMITASQQPLWLALSHMEAVGRRMQSERSWVPRLTDMMLPALSRMGDAFARDAAGLAVAEASVAIERYRLANGNAPPEQLENLVPGFLPAAPVDPFDGKPLRYRRDGTAYVVYSIGDDMKDDGGEEPAHKRESSRPADVLIRVDHIPADNGAK